MSDTPRTDEAEEVYKEWLKYSAIYGNIPEAMEQAPEDADPFAISRKLEKELTQANTEIADLRAQLETERLRLAACGVVAMANTPESAARAREMKDEYRSASLDDVIRAVDAEMSLRAQLAERDAALEALIDPTPEMIEEGAQRLARWDDGCVWPDSWGPLQVSGMRHDAEACWRSMAIKFIEAVRAKQSAHEDKP